MKRYNPPERRKILAQELVSEGKVRVGRLAEQLGVSTETIRKDLIFLEKEGIAVKSHGKAVVSSSLVERSYVQKERENKDAKIKIAKTAIELIPPQGTVILDAGSTNYEIARLLTLRKGLHIITNSVSIMQLLASTNHHVFMLGGQVRKSSLAIVGGWAQDELNMIEADLAFIGTDGFLHRNGPTTAVYEEAYIKQAIIKSSMKTVIVADHSKFHQSNMMKFIDWSGVDSLLTDDDATPEDISQLRERVEIIIAGN